MQHMATKVRHNYKLTTGMCLYRLRPFAPCSVFKIFYVNDYDYLLLHVANKTIATCQFWVNTFRIKHHKIISEEIDILDEKLVD